MSDNDQSQEKSVDPTLRRLERARREGDIPRLLDLQTAAAYIGFATVLGLAGPWVVEEIGRVLIAFLVHPITLADRIIGPGGAAGRLDFLGQLAPLLLVVLLGPALAVFVVLIAARGIVFSTNRIMPKLSNISPVSNAGQKYGIHGIVEFLKSFVKMTAVSAIIYLVLSSLFDELPGYTRIEPRAVGILLSNQLWSILWGVIAVAFIIAVLDFLWQNHAHKRRLRMSHQELRDETKQSEGDPQLRQMRRDRARELANNRMLLDVPTADVVITNPTHYAVALRWDRNGSAPPVCVAKGVDEIAQRIREIAVDSGIPIHSEPATARSLYAMVAVRQPIKPEHFQAVASAIIFADRVRQRLEREVRERSGVPSRRKQASDGAAEQGGDAVSSGVGGR